MIRFRQVCLTATVILGASLVAVPALGQNRSSEMDAIARNHYDNANRYYVIHRYDEAAREFQAAFDISHRVELLFNLGRALEDSGHDEQALDAYNRFAAGGSPEVDRAVLEARINGVRARLAARPPPPGPSGDHPATNPPVPGPVTTVPVTTNPPPPALPVPAPVIAPHPTTPQVTPPPNPPVVVTPPETRSIALPVGLMIGGGVFLATGLGLGVSVLIAHSDVANHCSTMVDDCGSKYVTEASNAHTRGYIGDALGLVGLAAGAVGVVLLLTGGSQTSTSPHVSAMCVPGACQGGLTVRF